MTDLLTMLQDPKRSILSLMYGSNNTNAYVYLAKIFKRATTPPMAPKEPRVVPTTNIHSKDTPPSRVTPTRLIIPDLVSLPRVVIPNKITDKVAYSPRVRAQKTTR